MAMGITSTRRLTALPGTVRQPGVAGFFYPDDPNLLQQMLQTMLQKVNTTVPPPKALIAPHAGYIYSGPVAASAYATLSPLRHIIRRVVLLGPAHRVYLQGMALSSATQFVTPLGVIQVDHGLTERVKQFPIVSVMDSAFEQEHSLEVHMPFLQYVLDDFTLLPIVTGDTPAYHVAEVLQSVWGSDETLIIISSDLSHYHDYETAKKLDNQTGQYIKTLQHEKLGSQHACGCMPMHGLLEIAKQDGLTVNILDIRNSGDTAGSHDRVVGYGAFSVHQNNEFNSTQRTQLLEVACHSIEQGFNNDSSSVVNPRRYDPGLQQDLATFVTLTADDQMRGCMGTTEIVSTLLQSTADNAFSAAFRDPRFSKLTRHEFKACNVGISVLTAKQEIKFDSEQTLLEKLRPGKDGLIIEHGRHRATFLPAVWENITDPEQFLYQLKAKAGIAAIDTIDKAWIYGSVSFSRLISEN